MKGVIGGADRQFYADPLEGMEEGWEGLPAEIAPGQILHTYKTVSVLAAGEYALQHRIDSRLELKITAPAARILPWQRGQNTEQMLQLQKGINRICAQIRNTAAEVLSCTLSTRLLDSSGNIVGETTPVDASFPLTEEYCHPLPAYTSVPFDGKEPELSGYTPAAGAGFLSCGRFGYSKGDGVLDYSMPAFGIVSRPFISGHPRYHKDPVWSFSLLPPGESETGSRSQVYHVPENETVECDWTHTCWSRQLSDGKYIAFDYSVLSTALLIETDLTELTLSRLNGIGTFQAITLPLANGAVTRGCRNGVFYDARTDGPLAQNWLLLSHSGRFPEVPVQLTLPTSPTKILRTEDTVILCFGSPMRWAMLSFPYGIQLFDTDALTEQWYAHTVSLCAAAHSRDLARPTACREYFKRDGDRIQIQNHYTYRNFEDSLRTPCSPAALLPPPAVLAQRHVSEITLDSRAISLEHPTKYGPLHGIPGSSYCVYTLPIPAYRCEFPFRCQNADQFGNMLHSDFDEYLRYHQEVDEIRNPGNYSFIFQYALPAKLFPVLKPEDLQQLKKAMEAGLRVVCDPDFRYTGPDGRRCFSWYQRTEPFTGVSYYSTYLHVSNIRFFDHCDKELIESSDRTFIEVDWGNAMSLYGTYLAALFTGQWELIRKHWHVFRKAFDYYLVTMDWACMTAAYAENGITWNDGTGYGGYLGFLNMADLLGMEEDRDLALYAYAKMTAMRMGLFVASQDYYCHYFDVEPWYTAKFFHEETDAASAFQNYPDDIVANHYRGETLYNLTTEGHYTEAMQMYASYLPEQAEKMLQAAEGSVQNAGNTITGATDLPLVYHSRLCGLLGHQETFTYLFLSAMLKRFPPEILAKMIQEAADNGRIAKEMLGHPVISRRRVPKNWTYTMLMCYLQSGNTPRITAWQNLDICRAAYPAVEVEVRDGAWLEVTCKTAPSCRFNGTPIRFTAVGKHLWQVQLSTSGTLEFI